MSPNQQIVQRVRTRVPAALSRDIKRINEYEQAWRKRHGEPFIPDFRRYPRVPTKQLRELQAAVGAPA